MARSVWPPSYGRSKPFINRHITAGGPSLLIIYPRRFTSIDFSLHKFSAAFRTFPKYCAYVGNAPLGAELMRGMNCAAGKRGQFQCKTGQVSPQRTCAVSLAATVIVAETKNDGVAAAIAQKAIYGKWVTKARKIVGFESLRHAAVSQSGAGDSGRATNSTTLRPTVADGVLIIFFVFLLFFL